MRYSDVSIEDDKSKVLGLIKKYVIKQNRKKSVQTITYL